MAQSWNRPKGPRVVVRPPKEQPKNQPNLSGAGVSSPPKNLGPQMREELESYGVRYPPRQSGDLPGDRLRRVATYAEGAAKRSKEPSARAPRPGAVADQKKTAPTDPWDIASLIRDLAEELGGND